MHCITSGTDKAATVQIRLETHTSMLESAKQVLSGRIETMQEEGLLALLEETFPYVSHLPCKHSSGSNVC